MLLVSNHVRGPYRNCVSLYDVSTKWLVIIRSLGITFGQWTYRFALVAFSISERLLSQFNGQ